MPVVSTSLLTLLQMALNMSLSHFMDEHAGSSEAKASMGGSFSMEFSGALSILVMAPRGAFTCL
jgi:hypothetical protein